MWRYFGPIVCALVCVSLPTIWKVRISDVSFDVCVSVSLTNSTVTVKAIKTQGDSPFEIKFYWA